MKDEFGDLEQRTPRQRDSAFMGWVATTTCCIACLIERGVVNREIQVAHYRTGDLDAGWRSTGMAEKPDDRRSCGLCMPHHTGDVRKVKRAQHQGSEADFWEALGVDPVAYILALNEAYDAGRSGMAVVTRFAGMAR